MGVLDEVECTIDMLQSLLWLLLHARKIGYAR